MHDDAVRPPAWVDLDAATDDDLAALRDRAGVPPFLLELAQREHHRPRVDRHGEHLMLVLKPATYVDPDEVVVVGQLVVLVGPSAVLALGTGDHQLAHAFRHRLADPSGSSAPDAASALLAAGNQVVEGYTAVLEELETDVDQIEAEVFSPARGNHAERIYRLKSEVQELRRAAGPLPEVLDELTTDPGVNVAHLHDRFRDVRSRAVRTAEHVAQLDELLGSVLHAHLTRVAIQQNDDMRRISAWVAIVAAPTAMASIYGMNFRHMPELGWRYGYAAVLAVMATVCVVLYRLFRRSGWL